MHVHAYFAQNIIQAASKWINRHITSLNRIKSRQSFDFTCSILMTIKGAKPGKMLLYLSTLILDAAVKSRSRSSNGASSGMSKSSQVKLLITNNAVE
jgi:hypothetical protein